MGWLTNITFSGFSFKAACGCHTGLKRENNEDNFLFGGMYLPTEDQDIPNIWKLEGRLEDRFFAVFDGMGGGDYGEVASNAAAAEARSFLDREESLHPYDITPSLDRLCRQMNQKVFRRGYDLGSSQTGTTVVSLLFHREYVWICNLGDSRGYLLDRSQMTQISLDHNDEAEMLRNGITGRKPHLTQYLGIDPEEMSIEPYIRSMKIRKGTRFLLCSDGLTDMVPESEIRAALIRYGSSLDDLEQCVKKLMDMSLAGGGRDNITIMIIDVL